MNTPGGRSLHAAAAAAGVIVAVVVGLVLIRNMPQAVGAARLLGGVRAQPTATPASTCRIPVTTLSAEKGNSLGGGFLSLPDSTYQTDPASSRSYDVRFQRWLHVDPELIAPDSASYVDFDSRGVFQVDLATGNRRLLLPVSAG